MMATPTDHSADIEALRTEGRSLRAGTRARLTYELAADLLELHDTTGISLDDWASARALVERLLGHPITPNGV